MHIVNKNIFIIPRWLIILAFAVYLFVAYQSSGYHNADEHYQIVEFANYKLGKATADDLAWEFKARIRSGLQPGICYFVFKVAYYIGVSDIYILTFLLRATTAIIAVFLIWKFILACDSYVKRENRNIFLALSFFLWFLPYINVRFSSESWSGLAFLSALTITLQLKFYSKTARLMLLGACLGIAILFRYQSGILALSLVLWLLLVFKLCIPRIAIVCGTSLVILILGIFIDHWLYGSYTFTLYNYFHANIVNDIASRYGVSPWYEMIFYILRSPGIFGPFIFLSLLALVYYQPKSVIVWSVLPFLMIHTIIPHKELRFLFPLANLIPLALITAYQQFDLKQIFKSYLFKYAVIFILFVGNIAGLLAISLKGAGTTKASVAQFIDRTYTTGKVNLIYVNGCNPYLDWKNFKNTFYHNPKVKLTEINTIWQPDLTYNKKTGYTNLLIFSNEEITGPRTYDLLKRLKVARVYQSIPDVIQLINHFYGAGINESGLLVYEFE